MFYCRFEEDKRFNCSPQFPDRNGSNTLTVNAIIQTEIKTSEDGLSAEGEKKNKRKECEEKQKHKRFDLNSDQTKVYLSEYCQFIIIIRSDKAN